MTTMEPMPQDGHLKRVESCSGVSASDCISRTPSCARHARGCASAHDWREAEVADADEALRQDVQQIAAQELVGVQFHDLVAVAVAVVLVREPHPRTAEGEDAAFGDGDAVRICRQIAQHLLGPAERLLGIYDPLVGGGTGQ